MGGGKSSESISDVSLSTTKKNDNSRTGMRKCDADSAANERSYGLDRGMNLQMKIQCGMIAQSEEDAIHHRRELKLVQLSKLIESMENLIGLKLKMVDRIGNGDSSAQFNMSINILMEKLERLNGELEQLSADTTKINPIVGSVLDQAAKAMGLPKRDDLENDDEDVSFVASILGNE
jgi:hypothetical protein